VSSEDLYLSHRLLIEGAIAAICRRQHLSAVDAEDFSGAVRLHLIDDDYAVLRKFENRSSLQTYLLTVITHRYQDWRNAHWGKWRPSAEARRQGPVAQQLERLMVRDGLSFDQAHETLRTNFQVDQSRQSLEAMASRFRARTGRHFVSDDALEAYPAADTRADAPLRDREAAAAARVAAASLRSVVAGLAPQDRLILRMRFADGCSIAQIARALSLEQKALYRRIDRLLAELRVALENQGLTASAAAAILQDEGFERLADDEVENRGGVRPFIRGDGSPVQNTRTP
jgi:RNA polymerase sigma factor (sigma-70 family)